MESNKIIKNKIVIYKNNEIENTRSKIYNYIYLIENNITNNDLLLDIENKMLYEKSIIEKHVLNNRFEPDYSLIDSFYKLNKLLNTKLNRETPFEFNVKRPQLYYRSNNNL